MAKKRATRRKRGGGAKSSGSMSGMRSGFKDITGSSGKRKPNTKGGQILNWVLWGAVAAVAAYTLAQRLG